MPKIICIIKERIVWVIDVIPSNDNINEFNTINSKNIIK